MGTLRKITFFLVSVVVMCVFFSGIGECAFPWQTQPKETQEESYFLTNKNGPWLIMGMVFADQNADAALEKATGLVKELRANNYKAYIYKKSAPESDYTEGKPRLRVDKETGNVKLTTTARYLNKVTTTEFAVMIGDFASLDDPKAAPALGNIHKMSPKSLQGIAGEPTHPLFQGDARRVGTPMKNAFMTPNPLMPQEYFVRTGLDKTVLEANKGIKQYSLLDCPGKYSVQVAVLKGVSTLNQQKIMEAMSNRNGVFESEQTLAEADANAMKLCEGLRKLGWDAYVFRDHYASIVTIGSFESIGTMENNELKIDQAIQQIFTTFSATCRPELGLAGIQRKTLNEIPYSMVYRGQAVNRNTLARIPFDVTPKIIVVPRRPMVNTAGTYAYGR